MRDRSEKPSHISQADWDSVDVPEMTDLDFERKTDFAKTFPGLHDEWKRKRGRPAVETPKVHIGFRLSADVVSGIKETGKGYNARVEKVLRNALAKGRL